MIAENKSFTLSTLTDESVCYELPDANGGGVQARYFESMSMKEENWSERKTANALRAGASKSAHVIVLNDQGGGVMSVSDKPSTLRAQMKHHEPVVCYPINTMVATRGGAGRHEDNVRHRRRR